jgi:hypothetical protein
LTSEFGGEGCDDRHRMVLLIASTQTMTNMASKTGGASPQISPGRTRTYYIAADDVTWDYVPGGVDVITGQPFKSFGSFQVAGKRVDRPVPTTYL